MSSLLARLRNGSVSSATALPAFLSLPLDERDGALDSILQVLGNRENDRRFMGAGARAKVEGQSADLGGVVVELSTAEQSPVRYATTVGQSKPHVKKNRYTDIVAYDRTRCLLPPETLADDGEYVNATLIQEPDLGIDILPRRYWVAAQAPIASTIHAFLSLLLTPPTSSLHRKAALQLPNVIVQITPLVERRMPKCEPYFPENPGEIADVPPRIQGGKGLWVRLDSKEKIPAEVRRVSKITVGWAGEEHGRQITHIEYLGWGDHGIPKDPAELLSFIHSTEQLNNSLSTSATDPAPILIHCSAGVGRTGTYITVSSLLPLISHLRAHPTYALPPAPPPASPASPLSPTELGPYPTSLFSKKLPRDVVGETIDGLREQRCTMVQTPAQVKFCYIALATAWRDTKVN